MRNLFLILLVLLLISAVCGGCFWIVSPYENIGRFNIGDGYALYVWTHIDHFEIEPGFPRVYYQITRGSRVVVRHGYIGLHRGELFDFKIVFAENGQLACVYNGSTSAFLLFDLRTEESYPRHSHHDANGRPIPMDRWVERVRILRRENPGMPQVPGFEEPD
jgi:hypothetical protein